MYEINPYVSRWNGAEGNLPPLFPEQGPEQPWSAGKALLVGAGLVGLGYLLSCVLSELTSSEPQRTCSVCGRRGHDRRTCPYDGPREQFSSAIPKIRRCHCCGQYGYSTKRHHTRGRANASDHLDVCDACHLTCGHGGDFRNLPIKPRFCRILDRPSFWRN